MHLLPQATESHQGHTTVDSAICDDLYSRKGREQGTVQPPEPLQIQPLRGLLLK